MLTTKWRLITGLGTKHPLENGFTFDRAVGVPYLPGSSVKGIARAGAETILSEDPKLIKEILGSEEDKAKESPSAGTVIFLDAYPVDWPKLEPDVMTPHYGDYYSSDKRNPKPAADQLDPKPIHFLTVAKGTAFRFVVLPRTEEAKKKDHVQKALRWLEKGLSELGAGAKTAVGYGYFVIA